jgi:Leucine-rich repeat (LRR) protein
MADNELSTVPAAVRPLTTLQQLNLAGNRLSEVDGAVLAKSKHRLVELYLGHVGQLYNF